MTALSIASYLILYVWIFGIYNLGVLAVSRMMSPGHKDFTIGFGPRIASFSFGTTHYQLRLIPLHAEVESHGEAATGWRAEVIQFGGPAALFGAAAVAAFLVLVTGVWVPHRPGAEIIYAENLPDTLRDKDVIVRANGDEVRDGTDLARVFARWREGSMTFEVERDGATHTVRLDRTQDGSKSGNLEFHSVLESTETGVVSALFEAPSFCAHVFIYQYGRALTDRMPRMAVRLGRRSKAQAMIV